MYLTSGLYHVDMSNLKNNFQFFSESKVFLAKIVFLDFAPKIAKYTFVRNSRVTRCINVLLPIHINDTTVFLLLAMSRIFKRK